jgi:shikimate kinase
MTKEPDKETRRQGDKETTPRPAIAAPSGQPGSGVPEVSPSPCLLVSLSPCLLVWLIGYRGTGKTTVGRLLADRLGWGWVDCDVELERRAGRTIRQIFAAEGEAGFRLREAELLEELCGVAGHVVATGGGVVLDPRNRERLRQAGRVVWLTADAATVWQRLQGDAATAERRPTLTVGGLAEVEELLRAREPLYRECAHTVVATAGRSPEEVVAEILSAQGRGR